MLASPAGSATRADGQELEELEEPEEMVRSLWRHDSGDGQEPEEPEELSRSAEPSSKRARGIGLPDGPRNYADCLQFSDWQVQYACGPCRTAGYGPCTFASRQGKWRLLLSTDYSGLGSAEIAACMLQDSQ